MCALVAFEWFDDGGDDDVYADDTWQWAAVEVVEVGGGYGACIIGYEMKDEMRAVGYCIVGEM